MWNWQKIDGIKNLPDFKSPVLLFQEKDGRKYATVGYLISIDANGTHWSSNGENPLFNLFGTLLIDTKDKDEFKPTHWCKIVPPEENQKTK
jgi:hypothetical protein